jgi:ATP-dependent Clp protease protease subunit
LLSGVLEGQATDLEIEARHILRLREQLYTIYSEATGQTEEKISNDCERNLWLSSSQMLDYGLIDSVLTSLPGKTKND